MHTPAANARYREDLQARYHNAENGKDILTAKLEQLKSELNVKEEKYKQVEVNNFMNAILTYCTS